MRNNRVNRQNNSYHEFHAMPSSALASTLLAGVTEKSLRGIVFGLIFSVPSVRRRCIKILITTFFIGVILGGFTLYYASRAFDSYLGNTLAREKVSPDKNH